MSWYARVVAHHPYIIVLLILSLSIASLIISLTSSRLPKFSDPQLGFETRGTKLAQRLTAWDNLCESTRPSGILMVNPSEYKPSTSNPVFMHNDLFHAPSKQDASVKLWGDKNESSVASTRFWVPSLNASKVEESNQEKDTVALNEEDEWVSLLKGPGIFHDHEDHHDHLHLSIDGFFCDGPTREYSHIVIESSDPTQSLLSLDALYSACEIQNRLMKDATMNKICETKSPGHCCIPWSLPSYIWMLNNRTSCFDITEDDVDSMKTLLLDCAKFYNNLQLRADCYPNDLCPDLPAKCTKYNAVYKILYYFTDKNFLPANYTRAHHGRLVLNYSMIFLPMARSSDALPYYYSLSSSSLKNDSIHVSAIDFGLKNALFDACLVKDALLMIFGAIFMVICMVIYTRSFLITICTAAAIAMSLIVSYFTYTFVFNIKFFPFMNLLAIIVAVGIGADDAFIYCKIWQTAKLEKVNATMFKLVSDTLSHAVVSMFVTSVTTAAAFYSSSFSSITAISCFSIFAGTAVLVNFILMVTWLPACVVIEEKMCRIPIVPIQWRPEINSRITIARKHTVQIKALLDRCLIYAIARLRWLWILIFLGLAIGGAVVVLYHPKLKLPDSKNFHLFESKHLFEQYDIKYKDKFWFEVLEKSDSWDNVNVKLPLRFVWGVLPVDNGNYLEPKSKGTLEFDDRFDISSPESQLWLLKFCRQLRIQPFYQPTLGPLLPNCFIESLKNWMERRCKDPIDNIDRTPCCETSKFPYSRDVFNKCIVKAVGHLYETPADYFLPGVAGPKFSKSKMGEIRAVVVEYDSNHSYSMSFKEMNEFYDQVETWFQKQLSTAPVGMKKGWFISDLDFYDLQLTLSNGTLTAISVSMIVAFVVVFFVTLNIFISFFAIVTVTCIIFVTVALLVLLGWKLNVLESVAVTTAIGLAVDFSLHYGINYRLSEEENREPAVAFALNRMGGPTLMAALTTAAAGASMLPSSVLAYIQIGMFLVIVMGVSWIYSTVFLMSLLSICGPQKGYGQFSYLKMCQRCIPDDINSPNRSDKTVYTTVHSESTLSTSSVTGSSAIHDGHELEGVTRSSRRIRRSVSRNSRKRSIPADQSPSAVLLVEGNNIVMTDNLEVETRPKDDDENSSRH